MIERLFWIKAAGTVPYDNMALEEYLLYHTKDNECILYLWQNRRTVVIGRNQNAWKECRCERLESDGGYLARRLSGGGAVFHDTGNLNFTFLTRKQHYDVEKQTEVILRAVRALGIPAEKSGRNDLTADGRKFSGNAYYRAGDACYHHGTLLLHTDRSEMSRYLNVSKEKLKSKGVESVRSRVVNLDCYVPGLSAERMGERLTEAFSQIYGLKAERFPVERLEQKEIGHLREKYASWDWKYGRQIPFTDEAAQRFDWGEVQIRLDIDRGRVKQVRICTDALDDVFPGRMEAALPGTVFTAAGLRAKLREIEALSEIQRRMKRDMEELLAYMAEA